MDGQRFDHWTRSLSSFGSSRRDVAKLLGGGTLSALLAPFGREGAAAKCVKPGRTCKTKQGKRKKCCGGAKCQGKICKCTRRREACGKKCCPKGQSCVGRKCVPGRGTCPTGENYCASVSAVNCNGNTACFCFQRRQGGTICGQFTDITSCDQCASDADCLDLGLPSGSSCMRDDPQGGVCECLDPGLGACVAPCGAVPVVTPMRSFAG